MNNHKHWSIAKGSPRWSFSPSDGVATLRDAVLAIVSAAVTYVGDNYFGGFTPELQAALGVVVFAGLKLLWKFANNTERVSGI